MRAAVRGSEDLVELTQVNGTWITDDCEPVQVTFEWQRVQRRESKKSPWKSASARRNWRRA